MVSCILGAKYLIFECVSELMNEWLNKRINLINSELQMNIRTELCLIINFYYFQSLVVSMGLKKRMGQIWKKLKINNDWKVKKIM